MNPAGSQNAQKTQKLRFCAFCGFCDWAGVTRILRPGGLAARRPCQLAFLVRQFAVVVAVPRVQESMETDEKTGGMPDKVFRTGRGWVGVRMTR